MRTTLLLAAAITTFASLVSAQQGDKVRLERIHPKLETLFPVALAVPPDGTGREFLVLQRGQVIILPKKAGEEPRTFLDFSSRGMEAADGKFEEGINGFAFHPKFKTNRQFYLCYTLQKPKRLVISEMRALAKNSSKADIKSERIILEIPLVNWNHHGGNILFGPDGFLYIGVGDTSKRDDNLRMAQLNAVLVGKILRIDVDKRDWDGGRYGIPEDNPFISGLNALPQIYATGIRNPWGMTFDEKGRLWCGDVGQDLWEEINLIVKGGNYGWSHKEGTRAFPLRTDPMPADAKFVDPVHEYNHGEGLSITGGIIYRGEKLPALKGAYIYGDFVIGKIWALRLGDDQKVASNELIFTSPQEPTKNPKKPAVLIKPTAFCEGADKELIVLDWNGTVRKMTPPAAAP